MKRKLNIENLWLGDVILIGRTDAMSKAICEKTGSRYSHAMLMWNGALIHVSDLVITTNPSRLLLDNDESICVLRLRSRYWSRVVVFWVTEYARNLVGTLYDKDYVNAMYRGDVLEYSTNRQTCSRFIAQCFAYVGINLVDDIIACTPENLRRSKFFKVVKKSTLPATDRDILYANTPDVTEIQNRAILSIIRRLYVKYPKADIMSLSQLENFVEKNPQESDTVLGEMKKTEYFNLYDYEERFCSYLYDVKKFEEQWGVNNYSMARSVLNDSKRILKERLAMMVYYEEKYNTEIPLAYYREMMNLQRRIITGCEKRIAIAQQILGNNY